MTRFTSMRRWIWNIVCALSVVTFALGMTLWVRSYLFLEDFMYLDSDSPARHIATQAQDRAIAITWSSGTLSFGIARAEVAGSSPGGRGWHHHVFKPSPSQRLLVGRTGFDQNYFRFCGFQFRHFVEVQTFYWTDRWIFSLPLWLFLIFALPSLLWWRKRRKRGGKGFDVTMGRAATEPNDQATKATNTSGRI